MEHMEHPRDIEALSQIELIAEDANRGEIKALQAYEMLKDIEQFVKQQIDRVKPAALEEVEQLAEEYGAKEFEHNGYKVRYTDGRAMYSFKHIPEWVEANDALKALEAKHKQAYANMNKNMHAVSEDGEVITPAKVSYSKPSISVKPIK